MIEFVIELIAEKFRLQSISTADLNDASIDIQFSRGFLHVLNEVIFVATGTEIIVTSGYNVETLFMRRISDLIEFIELLQTILNAFEEARVRSVRFQFGKHLRMLIAQILERKAFHGMGVESNQGRFRRARVPSEWGEETKTLMIEASLRIYRWAKAVWRNWMAMSNRLRPKRPRNESEYHIDLLESSRKISYVQMLDCWYPSTRPFSRGLGTKAMGNTGAPHDSIGQWISRAMHSRSNEWPQAGIRAGFVYNCPQILQVTSFRFTAMDISICVMSSFDSKLNERMKKQIEKVISMTHDRVQHRNE